MSLICCPECSHKISEWALWCPSCGISKKYFASHIIRIPPDYLDNCKEEMRLARGYHVDTSEFIPQKKRLFTPSGESVDAKYYNEDLMFINGVKVLGSIIGQELKEQNPMLEPSKYEGIEILSRKLPDHGTGYIVRPYLKNNAISVLICFPNSRILRTKKMQTTWDIDAFSEENLYSPQMSTSKLKSLLIKDAKSNYSNIDLPSFLKLKAEERINVLSKKLGREVYNGECSSCGTIISSAENQICDYCGTSYVCSRCGYCPTCHINPEDDPFYREMRLRMRITDAEWKSKCEKAEEREEDSICEIEWDDCPCETDIEDISAEYFEFDDDTGPAEESYEYYHGDDEADIYD